MKVTQIVARVGCPSLTCRIWPARGGPLGTGMTADPDYPAAQLSQFPADPGWHRTSLPYFSSLAQQLRPAAAPVPRNAGSLL